MREACDPVSTAREEEADEWALKVLTVLLKAAPYREPVFTERGSLYWNIDQLALATDAWQRSALEVEFASQPKLHASFTPTQFPTPANVIVANARRFVCEVLQKTKGAVLYPGKSASHPPLEQRLRRIAEVLKPVADALPNTGGQRHFAPIARLQQDLSPIFTHIYRETGIYMMKLQGEICSIVNLPQPAKACGL